MYLQSPLNIYTSLCLVYWEQLLTCILFVRKELYQDLNTTLHTFSNTNTHNHKFYTLFYLYVSIFALTIPVCVDITSVHTEFASDRNEYQEYFLGGKGGRCIGLTTLPPSCADCLEIWESQPPETLRGRSGL